MPWLLLMLLAADAPDLNRAATRLHGSAGRLQAAASRIAAVGQAVERAGQPHSLGPVSSDRVVVLEQLAQVTQHVAELAAAAQAE